jgi:signal transduction histidine kinase
MAEDTTTSQPTQVDRRAPRSDSAPEISWPLVERRRASAPLPGGVDRRRPGPTAGGGRASGFSESAQIIPAPPLATFRWGALLVGLIVSANGLADNWWPTAPILGGLVLYTTFVTIHPILYRDDRSTRTRVSLDMLIHLGAVMLTGNWSSAFAFTLIPSTLLAGFSSGLVFAFQTMGASAAIVSVRYLAVASVSGGLSRSAAWCGVLALVALTSGLARRVSDDSQQKQAIALDRLTKLSEANALLFSLQRVAQSLPASLDLDDVLDSTLTRLRSLIDADAIAILLYSDSDRQWDAVRTRGVRIETAFTTDTLPPPLREAMTASRTISVEHLDREGPGLFEDGGSGLYASLRARGALIGLISVESRGSKMFSSQHVEVLNGLIESFGIAIDNARLFQRLRSIGADEERSRIARELHDRVGNSLALLGFEVDRIGSMSRRGNDVSDDLTGLRDQVKAAVGDVRETLYDLRTEVSDEQDLTATLLTFSERVRGRSGIDVDVQIQAPTRLPILQERELWQIAREAITNVERHAEASCLVIQWRSTPLGAQLTINDDGKGFTRGAGRKDSYGLVGMRERAASINGTLDIDSVPGSGTTIRVALGNDRGGNT